MVFVRSLCFLCGFWHVTHQSDSSYLGFTGVAKWATQACTIPLVKHSFPRKVSELGDTALSLFQGTRANKTAGKRQCHNLRWGLSTNVCPCALQMQLLSLGWSCVVYYLVLEVRIVSCSSLCIGSCNCQVHTFGPVTLISKYYLNWCVHTHVCLEIFPNWRSPYLRPFVGFSKYYVDT